MQNLPNLFSNEYGASRLEPLHLQLLDRKQRRFNTASVLVHEEDCLVRHRAERLLSCW